MLSKGFDGLYYADARVLRINLEYQFLNNVDIEIDEILSSFHSPIYTTPQEEGIL